MWVAQSVRVPPRTNISTHGALALGEVFSGACAMAAYTNYLHMFEGYRGGILVRTHDKYLGTFPALSQAKDALSTHLGVCVAELPRRQNTAGHVRRSGSKHVYVKAAGYEVRIKGEYKGRYRTDVEAVRAVAREAGEPKRALRRSRAAGEPRSVGIRRFRVLKGIFKDGNGGCVHRGWGCPWDNHGWLTCQQIQTYGGPSMYRYI